MKIFYIHGAESTSKSFNYIIASLPKHNVNRIEYDTNNPLMDNIKMVSSLIAGEDAYIISHSLGGVISVLAANQVSNIKKIVTMSSPFGGSQFASMMRFVQPHNQLYKDISSYNPLYKNISSNNETLSFVTYGGKNESMAGENDGVVTLDSQMSLQNTTYIKLDDNHFEVLLDPFVVEEIKKFFKE